MQSWGPEGATQKLLWSGPMPCYPCACCSPVISIALFLNVLMTVPSFLRSRGLLLLSATFCFNRERTFKLGSEAGETRESRINPLMPPIQYPQPLSSSSSFVLPAFAIYLALHPPLAWLTAGALAPRGELWVGGSWVSHQNRITHL